MAPFGRARLRWRGDGSLRALGAMSLLGVALAGCLDPTQITLRIETDARCDELDTGIMVGLLGPLENTDPVATTQGCKGPDYIGSLVAIPSGDDDEMVAFKIVTSVGEALDLCYRGSFGPDCIEARRAVRYIPSTPLTLPIAMRDSCRGVVCPPDQTCVDGYCRPAGLEPEVCVAEAGCNESTLPGEPLVGWSKSWDTSISGAELALPPDDFYEYRPAVTVDAEGNVYVAGMFTGTFDLDGTTIGPTGTSDIDVFIAGFTPDGGLLWTLWPQGAGQEYPLDIAVGDDGYVYVTGYYTDTMDFDRAQLSVLAGDFSAFVAKLAPDSGSVEWAFGHQGHRLWYHDLVPGQGVMYAAGGFEGTASFPSPMFINLVATGTDLLVAPIDQNNGLVQSPIQSNGSHFEAAQALALDEAHRLHVAGTFAADVTDPQTSIGGLPLDWSGLAPGTPAHQPDAFYAIYEPGGYWSYARGFTGIGADEPVGIALARDGTATVAGNFAEALQVDPMQPELSGAHDLFLAWFPPDGAPSAQTFGSGEVQHVDSMDADEAGRLYLHGQTSGAFAFGSSELQAPYDSPFLFVAVLDRDTGEHRWSRALPLGLPYGVMTTGVAGRHGNEVFVTGLYNGSIEFDDGVRQASTLGEYDTYLARIVSPAQ